MRSRIRKSADYRIFAPARSLSQLVTSFFGSWCQGIRLVLFVTWPRPNYRLYVRSNRFAFLLTPDGWFLLSNKISRFYLALNFSVISTLFKYPHQRLCVGFYYYCFTRSENFLVFSVNQWNCILRSLSEPTKFWKNTLVIYLDFVFVVNLLIHNLILYSVFKVHFKPFGLWWRIRGSNPWPPACKAGALPAELIPHMLVFCSLRACFF